MIDNEALHSLERLHKLKEDGVITAEDFETAKEKLLQAKTTRSQTATIQQPSDSGSLEDHFQWMILPLRRYAQFEGRSSRKEFWMFILLANLVGLGLIGIALADTNVFGDTGTLGTWAFGLMGLSLLGIIIPLLAVEARRFHDQDKSGWLVLLNLIPYVGGLIVLVLMILPGTEGENQYGPDPRI